MTAQELNDFTRDVHEHLFGHILPFWCGPALDHEHGGWMAWLASDLASDRTKPKGLVVNARILWAFSAAHRSNPDEILRSMADRALDILMNRFWDQEHGGAYWQLADDWRLLDDSKKTYGQAFYIYALTEYHQAFGDAAALERAKEVFELIERHPRDVEFGGYFETRRADWSGADDVRLSEKDMNEKKSMNNHLHILEAFTNLVRAWSDARVAKEELENLKKVVSPVQ